MLDISDEVVFIGDVGRAGPPLSPEKARENQLKLRYAVQLRDQWCYALCKLEPIEILDAYVAAAYEDQGLHLSEKHPLWVFCEGGLLPLGLKNFISQQFKDYDFASIRQELDKRYQLPEPR